MILNKKEKKQIKTGLNSGMIKDLRYGDYNSLEFRIGRYYVFDGYDISKCKHVTKCYLTFNCALNCFLKNSRGLGFTFTMWADNFDDFGYDRVNQNCSVYSSLLHFVDLDDKQLAYNAYMES